jgi:hypothetical protein
MKKTPIFAAIALAAATAFQLTSSISFSNSSLKELIQLNSAQASCVSTVINNGRCSFSGNCFPNPGGPVDCDSTKG